MNKHDGGIIGNKDVHPMYFDKDGNPIHKIAGDAARKEYPVLTAKRIEKERGTGRVVTREISAHGMTALQDIAKQYFGSYPAAWVCSNGQRFYS